MTLTSAIEAAREALHNTTCYCDQCDDNTYCTNCDNLNKAIDALPDKPMTEDEIAKIIALAVFGECDTYELSLAMEAVAALKDAKVLFVKEK